jgi:broad specificity phosphatase PhoE
MNQRRNSLIALNNSEAIASEEVDRRLRPEDNDLRTAPRTRSTMSKKHSTTSPIDLVRTPSAAIVLRHGDADERDSVDHAQREIQHTREDTRFLTPCGTAESKNAGAFLRIALGNTPVRLVSSGLAPARQTAMHLAEEVGCDAADIAVDARLNEISRAHDDIARAHDEFEDPIADAIAAIEHHKALASKQGARVVIVTHGDILALVAAELSPLEESDDDSDPSPYPPHENCHITVLLDGTVRLYNMPPGTERAETRLMRPTAHRGDR